MPAPIQLAPAPEPTPVEEYRQQVQRAYDEASLTYDKAYTTPKHSVEDEFLVSRLHAGGYIFGDVLDAGCGTGYLLDQIPHLPSSRYLGIDLSLGMLQRAAEKFPKYRFEQRAVEEAPFTRETFDVVVSLWGVLNYCLRPEEAVASIYASLRPGGRLFFVVYGPRHRRTAHSYIVHGDVQPPKRLFDPHHLKRMLDVFFTEVEVQGMSHFLDWLPAWMPRWVFKLGMWVEQKTVARWFPSSAFYLVATARKAR